MLNLRSLAFNQIEELAKNSNTSSEVLAQIEAYYKLGCYKGLKAIARLIAGNPNTPIETLERLKGSYHEEIVANPAFELLLLEYPNRHFLKLCLAKSVKTPVETLEKLSCDRDFEIQKEIVKNPHISAKIIDRYAQNEKICRFHILDLVRHTDKISTATWLSFANHKNVSIREEIALNAQAPIEIIIALSNDSSTRVRSSLARNHHVPLEILARLAEDIEGEVRIQVVYNTHTPKEILIKLAQDSDVLVRSAVAGNSRTPVNLLIKLSQERNFSIRYGVAINSKVLVYLLSKLAEDSAEEVRSGVARNIQTPIAILEKLSTDPNQYIRGAAKKNLENISGN